MSLKQLKGQKDGLINPELDEVFPAGLTRVQQRQWKNTWRYKLNHKIPLDLYHQKKDQPYIKKYIRKYYGKKILYVSKLQEINAIVSDSKLLEFVEIEKDAVINLKSKGNLVILPKNIPSESKEQHYYEDDDDDLQEDNHLLIKKIIKYCSKAKITIEEEKTFKLAKYLLASKHLYIRIGIYFKLSLLREIIRNLLDLETIKIETIENWSQKMKKKPRNGFFTSLHKLSRLKRVKLGVFSPRILSSELERDLEEFYSQSINFNLSIKISIKEGYGEERHSEGYEEERHSERFGEEKSPNLKRILEKVEYLSISDYQDYDPTSESEKSMVAKDEKKKLKIGMRNIVRIYNGYDNIDVAEILSNCGSLQNLYARQTTAFRYWTKEKSAKIKGLQNLKVAVLEFCSYIDQDPFIICSQIKKNSHSLQYLSLYCKIQSYFDIRRKSPEKISSLKEDWKRCVEGISTLHKLKRFELVINPNNLSVFPLTKILSNMNLEEFTCEIKFDVDDKECQNCEWDPCFATENTSEIKKLSITIPEGRKIPLFGINLWDYIKELDNLQVVELLDKNCGRVTFDLLYGFVTSLLEKKGLRKLMILTKVMNNFYAESSKMLLPSNFDDQFKKMMIEVTRDWESRIKKLRDLEEIMVGRLHGYSFEYLFYHKEMQIIEKLFWNKKEILKRLHSRKTELSEQLLDFFNASGVDLNFFISKFSEK